MSIELKFYTCNPPAFTPRGDEIRNLSVTSKDVGEVLRGSQPLGAIESLTLTDSGWIRVKSAHGVFIVRDGQLAEVAAEAPSRQAAR